MSVESTVINALKGDATLQGLITEFAGSPAVFIDMAPETAITPYIVCRFDRLPSPVDIAEFNVFIGYFDYSTSSAQARDASLQIEKILDYQVFDDPENEYNDIRIFLETGGSIPTQDPRNIHYNLQFLLRAGRLAWSANL